MPEITTFLTYDKQAEEAVHHYLSVFESGKITNTTRAAGTVFSVTFELFGRTFIALNGGPTFKFSNGISLFVSCDTQAEIDRYWSGLVADGGKEVQCGWLVDRFGVSWQIVPSILPELLSDPDPEKSGRVMESMLQMKKIDVQELERAAAGE